MIEDTSRTRLYCKGMLSGAGRGRMVVMPLNDERVRVSGWPEGANPMHFIIIVREFTAVGLAEAKAYFDRLRAGESLVLVPYRPDQASAFAAKLLHFNAVQMAEVTQPPRPGGVEGGRGESRVLINLRRSRIHLSRMTIGGRLRPSGPERPAV